jgi:hypothetical protein
MKWKKLLRVSVGVQFCTCYPNILSLSDAELFIESGGCLSKEVSEVGDFKSYFGTELGDGSMERIMYQFTGLGTGTIDGHKRRIHSFKIVNNDNIQPTLFYKENDETGPWMSHWSGAETKALEVFKPGG